VLTRLIVMVTGTVFQEIELPISSV
jgi:hypothetical protein